MNETNRTTSLFAIRSGRVSLAVALFVAVVFSTLARNSLAQSSPQPPTGVTPLTLQQLQQRLKTLQDELAREKAGLAAREELQASELDELREQRRALADRLLSAQIETERNAGKLRALRDRAAEAETVASHVAKQAAAIAPAVRELVDQTRIHLNEIPGGNAVIEQTRAAAAAIDRQVADGTEKVGANSAHALGAVTDLLTALDHVHERASGVAVEERSLFTATGVNEQVKLLTLGHVRFAYETLNGGRIGLALASPRDASGFRWSENLTPQEQTQIRDAIAAVQAGVTGIAAVPIDPSGRIQPDSLNQKVGFLERVRSGGLVMYPLAALAVIAILLIAERLVVFYGLNRNADRVVQRILDACRAGDFGAAESACSGGSGAVRRVLAACLHRRALGQRAMEDSIQEQLLHEMPRLQRFMGGIATLAAVAPLLGLLGTVTGIIRTFGVIRAFGNANPSLMAGGISEALLTTATGLIIAVPILIIYSVLRGRSDRIVADAERYAANLLTTLVHESRTDGTVRNAEDSEFVQPARGNGQSNKSKSPNVQEVTVD